MTEGPNIVRFPEGTQRRFFVGQPALLPNGAFVTLYHPAALAGLRFEEIFGGRHAFLWLPAQEPYHPIPGPVQAKLAVQVLAAGGAVAQTYINLDPIASTLLADGDP